MPQPVYIDSSPARRALTKLLTQLDRANVSGLKRTRRKVRRRPAAVKGQRLLRRAIRTPEEWHWLLALAEAEIPQWCPNRVFSFPLPPKTRGRRTSRTRG